MYWQLDCTTYAATPLIDWFPHGKDCKIYCISSMSFLLGNTEEKLLVAFGTENSSIEIYELHLNSKTFSHVQRIDCGRHFMLALSFSHVPGLGLLLTSGGSDSKVHLYFSPGASYLTFQLCYLLEGHENWIRSLSLACIMPSTLLLASASQDKYVRIWNINLFDKLPSVDPACIPNSLRRYLWSAPESSLCIEASLAAVLLGHDDWVYSCKWVGSYIWDSVKNGRFMQIPLLLTASSDGSIILWQPYNNTWISMVG